VSELSDLRRELENLQSLLAIGVAALLQHNAPQDGKTLGEWIEYVYWLRTRTPEAEHAATTRQYAEAQQRYVPRLSLDEAAALVTGLRRADRARARFSEFRKYLRQPNTSMDLPEHEEFLRLDKAHTAQPALGWSESSCLWLKGYYPKWRELTNRQQARKSIKKRWTKKVQKIA
jgi:hypothetical protein